MKSKLFFTLLLAPVLLGCSNNSNPKQSDPILESISLSGTYQTAFTVNDVFNYDGLVVTAHYDNNTTLTVVPDSVSSPDMSVEGNKEVVVTYKKKNASYTIIVSEKSTETFEFTVDFTTQPEINGQNIANFEAAITNAFAYEDSNLVSNLTYTGYAQINHVEQNTGTATWTERALMIGNASGMGKLDFTFNKKLVSVQFIARTHIKLYAYSGNSGISADQNSKLFVNEETWSLTNRTVEDYGVDDREFQINSNQLTIHTLDESNKRVWIFSANFVFEK